MSFLKTRWSSFTSLTTQPQLWPACQAEHLEVRVDRWSHHVGQTVCVPGLSVHGRLSNLFLCLTLLRLTHTLTAVCATASFQLSILHNFLPPQPDNTTAAASPTTGSDVTALHWQCSISSRARKVRTNKQEALRPSQRLKLQLSRTCWLKLTYVWILCSVLFLRNIMDFNSKRQMMESNNKVQRIRD